MPKPDSPPKTTFHVSLYILIPLIFSGIILFSLILEQRVLEFYHAQGRDPAFAVGLLAGGLTLITMALGYYITRFLLRPLERFVDEARNLPTLPRNLLDSTPRTTGNEVERYSHILKDITNLLGNVEAQRIFPNIICQSKAMRAVLSMVLRVAPTDFTVLITGESGTGKELIAGAIVAQSRRKDRPFIKINCAAIPANLIESELFGHEKGAFTGATSQKPGKFELADGGTILLDEIGEMPMEVQAKILRVLQEQEMERVGGTKVIKVDVRILAATNRNLEEMSGRGAFREDLYYRLLVFNIHVPPLRERRDDIPVLAEYFLTRLPERKELSQQALEVLITHGWPGNIREFKHAVESAAVLSEESSIGIASLPARILAPHKTHEEPIPESFDLDAYLAETEKRFILKSLLESGGVQARASKLLGIKERSLWHRVKKYGIDIDPLRRK